MGRKLLALALTGALTGASVLTACHSDSPSADVAVEVGGCAKPGSNTDLRQAQACSGPEASGYPAYNASESYPTAGTVVSVAGALYFNNWWVSPGECPVKRDCPKAWTDGQWSFIDTSKPHEFTYYDHVKLQAGLPKPRTCMPADYELDAVRRSVDQSISSGSLSLVTPEGGWTARDREALYREVMLPCAPDLVSYKPPNVQVVERVMPPDVWESLAGKITTSEARQRYMNASGAVVPWPFEPNFAVKARSSFLSAVARYPFYCGEKGYFNSIDEACRREIAALFAHAAQEVSGGDLSLLFVWLREYGFVNKDAYFNLGCGAPFDCSAPFARYYGRGPKQLTYYYNYANFSAMTFNGDFNLLLRAPDIVSYDAGLYFLSGIYFGMTSSAPKPSMHQILLGLYAPDASCVDPLACSGVQYDAVSGVKHNFAMTIEAINGGVECRKGPMSGAAVKRSMLFLDMLTRLGVKPTAAELASPLGCDFVASVPADSSAFAMEKTQAQTATALNLGADRKCKAQRSGGAVVVSVIAPGMVDACRR